MPRTLLKIIDLEKQYFAGYRTPKLDRMHKKRHESISSETLSQNRVYLLHSDTTTKHNRILNSGI